MRLESFGNVELFSRFAGLGGIKLVCVESPEATGA